MPARPDPRFRLPIIANCIALFAATLLIVSCATKTAEDAAGEPTASPTPSPSPTPEQTADATPQPTPLPTPEQPKPVYTITVSTDQGETTQTVVSPEATPTPEPDESTATVALAEPPPATPEPTPEGNFLSRTWHKIFPKKEPKPAPEQPVITAPKEPFFARLWHSIFPKKKQPPAALPPSWLGTIKLVNERGSYVLIDSQGFVTPPAGELLTAIGNDAETASLRISADRDPPFYIADILSGKPQPGDKVYSPNP